MPRWGKRIILGDGTVMFVDGSGPLPAPCYICGAPSVVLCDYVLNIGLENPTCDRPLCKKHAYKPLPVFGLPETADIDYCPEHFEMIRSNDESK